MLTEFYKYQGTGNDFIIFNSFLDLTSDQIKNLCDRRYGIGADGIIYMSMINNSHFKMLYFNSDGSKSFCGNGSRCAVKHAFRMGWVDQDCTFDSNDGIHTGRIINELVEINLTEVTSYSKMEEDIVINTGSPHYLIFHPDLDSIDINNEAHKIRYNSQFKDEGINVNFLDERDNVLRIRTYERGVEAETYSCGTGVTAAAIGNYIKKGLTTPNHEQQILTEGGPLNVRFDKTSKGFNNIFLTGPAEWVFEGDVNITLF